MELIPNNKYKVKYTGKFCHAYGKNGKVDLERNKWYDVTFVGQISTTSGDRNIFREDREGLYLMFDSVSVNYVYAKKDELKDVITDLKNQINKLEEELQNLN